MSVVSPKLTVLLPVRNGHETLNEALESLQAQTLQATEILVVDDGSTDRTPDLLRSWKETLPNLRVMRTSPRGIIPSLQLALSQATGEYIARMDGDDTCHSRRFERQVDFLKTHPGVGVVGTLVKIFPREARREGLTVYEAWINSIVTPEEIRRDLFVECPIAHPSMMMRRDQLIEIGGYRDRGWPEDYDLLLRYAEAGYRLAKVPGEVLFHWREGPNRAFRTDPHYTKEAFRRCKAHYLARWPLSRRSPVWIWGAGTGGKRLARALAEEGIPVKAFVDIDPKKIGSTRQGRPILPPEGLKPAEGEIIVAAVAARGVREEVRERLRALGFEEGTDFICAA
jgi:glycosyltransferase involved in cell wall biosynthesis